MASARCCSGGANAGNGTCSTTGTGDRGLLGCDRRLLETTFGRVGRSGQASVILLSNSAAGGNRVRTRRRFVRVLHSLGGDKGHICILATARSCRSSNLASDFMNGRGIGVPTTGHRRLCSVCGRFNPSRTVTIRQSDVSCMIRLTSNCELFTLGSSHGLSKGDNFSSRYFR